MSASGVNSRYGKIDPYWMAASVIDEAIRNSVCVGGRRWALLDNFAWGNPEYEDRLGSLVYACRGCYDVAKVYEAPFVSGKDSLYNESPLGPVTPTLLITSLGILPDVRKAISMELKKPGNALYLVGVTKPEIGGSEYLRLNGELGGSVPKLDPETNIKTYKRVLDAMDAGLVRACHDCSEGGLAVALSEMAFTGDLGLDVDIALVPVSEQMRDDLLLFSESNGRLLIEVPADKTEEFEKTLEDSPYSCIGAVKQEKKLTVTKDGAKLFEVELDKLISGVEDAAGGAKMKPEEIRILIMRAPGTNCDLETVRAFEDLGTEVNLIHTQKVFKEKNLDEYNILVFPGGFSYGDYVRSGSIWAKECEYRIGKELSEFG